MAKLFDLKHHETRKKPLIVQFRICFHFFVSMFYIISFYFVLDLFVVVVVVVVVVVTYAVVVVIALTDVVAPCVAQLKFMGPKFVFDKLRQVKWQLRYKFG